VLVSAVQAAGAASTVVGGSSFSTVCVVIEGFGLILILITFFLLVPFSPFIVPIRRSFFYC
jgi:hypothetical protein